MIVPTLKRAIQALEEKGFYDIALLFLSAHGYKDLSVVDGTGDGGRDVTCSLKDLRIQLSVRKDWLAKINYESRLAKDANQSHLIYVTNRTISPAEQTEFQTKKHVNRGELVVVIYDLNAISTTLAQSGVIHRTYELLGMNVDGKLQATAKEIALSTLLLFSPEAVELRVNIVEANITAWMLKNGPASEDRAIAAVAQLLPYPAVTDDIKQSIGRMRAAGRLGDATGQLSLSVQEAEKAAAAEVEYLQSASADLKLLEHKYRLNAEDAQRLLALALELIVREKPLEERSVHADALATFVAEKKLKGRKHELYEDLAKTGIARFDQYGKAIDRILSTNTFDIYRALGRRTSITMMLDASVAMPMLCGLAFRGVRSRFGTAAEKLRMLCVEHNFELMVPSFYLNEMASHGLKAKDFVATYKNLPIEAREALVGSRNAYLSHFERMKVLMTAAGEAPPKLEEFLEYFGFGAIGGLRTAENRLASLLDEHGIRTLRYSHLDMELRERVACRKAAFESPHIIDHDAMALSLLHEDSESGFVFATWDNTLIGLVAEIDRIYADTPARVIDFLSMAKGAAYECDQSIDLLTSLIHIDDAKAAALAQKIEGIQSAEQAFRLRRFVDDARARGGPDWRFTDMEAGAFFQQDAVAGRDPNVAEPAGSDGSQPPMA
ncbi:MAG: hypothetical protein RLY71_3299 [Pseudomonadota bacterium]|jgi:hypothetical protein